MLSRNEDPKFICYRSQNWLEILAIFLTLKNRVLVTKSSKYYAWIQNCLNIVSWWTPRTWKSKILLPLSRNCLTKSHQKSQTSGAQKSTFGLSYTPFFPVDVRSKLHQNLWSIHGNYLQSWPRKFESEKLVRGAREMESLTLELEDRIYDIFCIQTWYPMVTLTENLVSHLFSPKIWYLTGLEVKGEKSKS